MAVDIKGKNATRKPSPNTGTVSEIADERGKSEQTRKNENKSEQKHKKYFYRTVLNTCLSFLNEVKNLAKDTGIKYAFCD